MALTEAGKEGLFVGVVISFIHPKRETNVFEIRDKWEAPIAKGDVSSVLIKVIPSTKGSIKLNIRTRCQRRSVPPFLSAVVHYW